ncbi:2OG-Fe(II)-dependent halogenase WelO5 family protein [Chitinimonas lacunae]|uniref:Prolyl 4-hydroxylase alpha subunit Fe(2+) 2OG dioxygenase domain-containing protein n=1 Tax=Chitinimonas lacunae TaxID=1963018 RepID=A0ABV8MTY5_9NEIS
MAKNWIRQELCELTEENLNLLLEFKIPGIIVENFLPPETCELVAERLRAMSFENYSHLKDIPVHHVGVCHNQWAHDDKSIYFDKIDQAKEVIDSIYRGLDINPVDMVMNAVASQAKRTAGLFEEPGFGSYFAGAFRSFRGHGRLHADHAPSHIRQPWAVTEISRQMTWNIYYSMLNSGGELVIYDTIHTAENDSMKVPGQYYFPYEVLEGPEHIRVTPKVGDLIMFNTQNFHEILGNTDGYRISQTSFIGLKKDGSLGFWS